MRGRIKSVKDQGAFAGDMRGNSWCEIVYA